MYVLFSFNVRVRVFNYIFKKKYVYWNNNFIWFLSLNQKEKILLSRNGKM